MTDTGTGERTTSARNLVCRLLGHSWRHLASRWANPNRKDIGGTHEWYLRPLPRFKEDTGMNCGLRERAAAQAWSNAEREGDSTELTASERPSRHSASRADASARSLNSRSVRPQGASQSSDPGVGG